MRHSAITEIKTFLLDLFFPKFCAFCGKEGAFVCADCVSTIRFLAPSCVVCGSRRPAGFTCPPCKTKTPLRRIFSPFSYKSEAVRSLLHIYKYGRAKEIGDLLGAFVARHMASSGFLPRKNIIILPVPLHPRRRRERGFNQSEILAAAIAARFGIPLAADLLIRRKHTDPQVDMKNDNLRRQNIQGAFLAGNNTAIKNKIILLVDDVLTSGATLEEAARTLKAAGARSVWAAVVARR